MKILSKEKNLEMPWYLLSLIEMNQEKMTIIRVPVIRTM